MDVMPAGGLRNARWIECWIECHHERPFGETYVTGS